MRIHSHAARINTFNLIYTVPTKSFYALQHEVQYYCITNCNSYSKLDQNLNVLQILKKIGIPSY